VASTPLFKSGAPIRAPNAPTDASSGTAYKIEERLSQELVIALVGPVGSGVSTTAQILQDRLEREFGYKVEYIKVSPLISENASLINDEIKEPSSSSDRIAEYQRVGNELRDKKGHHFLADCVMEKIGIARRRNNGFVEVEDDAGHLPTQVRIAYIIDSLKNPAEISRLRQIYRDILWVVTVFSPHDVRRRRLCSGGADEISASIPLA
jgi:hypothetical protein